jgi:hypothetical protein
MIKVSAALSGLMILSLMLSACTSAPDQWNSNEVPCEEVPLVVDRYGGDISGVQACWVFTSSSMDPHTLMDQVGRDVEAARDDISGQGQTCPPDDDSWKRAECTLWWDIDNTEKDQLRYGILVRTSDAEFEAGVASDVYADLFAKGGTVTYTIWTTTATTL